MTPEIAALDACMKSSGLPYRVTSSQRLPRFAGDTSYHIAGQAVDFAGPTPWNAHTSSPALLSIWQFWMERAGSLKELIYSGAPFFISKGVVRPISQLSPALKDAHWNHVHVAVPSGWTFTPKEIIVPDTTPDYAVNDEPVSLAITPSGKGYIILCKDGGVFCFGDAEYLGRVHKNS